MNTNKIANKIAKEFIAGGGAGINFEINDALCDLVIFAQGTIQNCKFTSKGSMNICSFDALGYDDGMQDVDGEKIFSSIDCSKVISDAIETIKDQFFSFYKKETGFQERLAQGIEFYLYPYSFSPKTYSWGWIRSKLKKGSKVLFGVEFEINNNYHEQNSSSFLYVDTEISAEVSSIGQSWYNDVFVVIPESEEEAEILSNLYREDYGR